MSLEWGGKRFRPVAPTTRVRPRSAAPMQRTRDNGVYLTGSFIQPSQQDELPPVPVETFYLLTEIEEVLQTQDGENILWTT